MAKVGLIQGFRNLEVGERQLLKIKKDSYEEKYMKCKVTFEDAEGRTGTETFMFKGKKKDTYNEVALGIFSTIAKCATHDFADREIDPEEIEGLHVIADVYMDAWTDDEGRSHERAKLRNYREAEVDDETEGDEVAEDDEDDLWD